MLDAANPPRDLRSLTDTASARLWEAMSRHDEEWGVQSCDWDVDQNQETIVFTHRDDGSRHVSPVQIVAIQERESGWWRWGWDHPSVLPNLRLHSTRVRDLGESWGFPQLSLPRVNCTEAQAWQLVAVAFEVNDDATGACRTPTDELFIFTTFGDVHPM